MMKHNYLKVLFILLALSPFNGVLLKAGTSITEVANAADKTIKGSVTTMDGEALPGVNVVIKGTAIGTTTDNDGKFSINIPEKEVTLVFSYIGFNTEEVVVSNQSVINVKLLPDIETLSDVVVVAYGKVKKSDLTGSVSSIKADEIKTTGTTSFDQALQGRAAGVVVTQTSGQPGGQASIRIRGTSSITAGNEPLYVVDGMLIATNSNELSSGFSVGPGISPLAALNPNDIESIEVLKDASATALYGSRATNGVVLITTKRGKEGTGNVNFESYYGWQQIANKLDVLDASEYAAFVNAAYVNSGNAPVYVNPKNMGKGTDWQNEIFRTAPISNYQLSFNGGDKLTKYAISAGYFDQEGIVINSNYKRYNFRANLDRDLSKKLSVGNSLAYSYVKNRGVFTGTGAFTPTVVAGSTLFNPILPIYDDTQLGGYTYENNGTVIGNPVAEAKESVYEGNSSRIIGNVFAKYTFFDGLEFRTSLGLDNLNSKDNSFSPGWLKRSEGSKGEAGQGIVNAMTLLNENTLSYDKEINPNHHINALIGFTAQQFQNEGLGAYVFDFADSRLGYHNLRVGANAQPPSNFESKWAMVSYLGRLNYSLHDKYLFTLTGRVDGSSKFAKANQYGFFPSGAFAWKVYKEEFMKAFGYISDLKLRLSYGLLGNQSISPYQSLSTVIPFGQGVFNSPAGSEVYQGKEPYTYANKDLKWESTRQFDAGVDFSILQNRISVTADYYIKKTFDLLLTTPIPQTTGFPNTLLNIGNVENKGFDLDLRTVNFTGKFSWKTGLNFSMNRNNVTNLNSKDDVQLGSNLILRQGESIGIFYGYVFDGIFQSDDEAATSPVLAGQEPTGANPKARAKAGDRKYRDLSGPEGSPDGKIDQYDRTIVGHALPDFTWGLNNDISFQNINLSFFIQGSQGNEMYNANNNQLENLNSLNNVLGDFGRNFWTPENRSNEYPRPLAVGSLDNVFSSRLIEDASYIRLKNVTLSYNLPSLWLQKISVKSATIFVSATNVLTITNYKGYDPEANAYGSSTVMVGVDQWGYPQAKTYSVGINLGF